MGPPMRNCASELKAGTTRMGRRKHTFAASRHDLPELCQKLPALQREGAGKTGCALHPAVSRAMCTKEVRTRAYRFSGEHPAFPAQWLYGLYVISPENGSFASVAPWEVECLPGA